MGLFLFINGVTIALIIVLVILVGVLVGLYLWGKKIEKRNVESKEAMEKASQTVSILVIDKKKMKMKDANLPKLVYEQTPKYLRRSKLPIVKAKVGPKVVTLIAAPEVFPLIPIKQEIKATISGIYITAVRGKLLPKPEKLTFSQKIKNSLFKKKNKA